MADSKNRGSVDRLSAASPGLSRRHFLRGLAAGSTAVAGIPLLAAVGSPGVAAAGPRAIQGEAVDVTLITAQDLPYGGIPTEEEQAADPAAKAYAEAIQPWFDENPGVKLEEIEFDVYNQETLLVAISGGTAPSFYPADVLATWDEEKVLAAEKSGLAADVTAQIEQYGLEAKLADYCLAIWNTKEIDGRHYALPYSYNVGDGIHYRIDLFQEAGIPEPTFGWTWPDLREMAKTLTAENRFGITLQDWGFSLIWVAEGWDFLTRLPAADTDWNWRWDYTSLGEEWAKYISWGREMVFQDQSVLRDIAMADDEILSQFIGGGAAMMNNNITYHTVAPSSPESMAATADQLGKPIQEVFGYIAHPVGVTGFNQTSFGQLDTMGFNPDLDEVALDKATSLHIYMMGPGFVSQKQAAFEISQDLRFVWTGGSITPLYKPSELEGIPGTPEEAWGEAFMQNIRDQANIPLMPLPHWFIPPQSESGPPNTAAEDARSKWFFEDGDHDILADLEQIQSTINDQAGDFTSEIPDDQFLAGATEYYAALGAYFETNAPDFFTNVFQPWVDEFVTPVLG